MLPYTHSVSSSKPCCYSVFWINTVNVQGTRIKLEIPWEVSQKLQPICPEGKKLINSEIKLSRDKCIFHSILWETRIWGRPSFSLHLSVSFYFLFQQAINLWSTGEETVRVLAFLVLNKICRYKKDVYLSPLLKVRLVLAVLCRFSFSCCMHRP